MKRILLLNHYLPPDPAPTGRLLAELGEMLEEKGWTVDLVEGSSGSYRRKKGSAAITYLLAHLRIFFRGLVSPRPDIILCLTDPPCLLLTTTLLGALKGSRVALWAMDLYPDLAVELGEIREGVISSWIRKSMQSATREADLVIALDEDMKGKLDGKAKVVPPWVERTLQMPTSAALEEAPKDLVWLYSGNLGRAHDWKTLLVAQQRLEEAEIPARLVIQGRGTGRDEAKEYAKLAKLQGVEFRDYAPREKFVESLLEAQVHVVTLGPALSGMLWPSKLALLLHLDRPILWVGDPESSPARSVKQHGHGSAAFVEGDSSGLANQLIKIWERPAIGHHHTDPHNDRLRAGESFHQWLCLAIGSAEEDE